MRRSSSLINPKSGLVAKECSLNLTITAQVHMATDMVHGRPAPLLPVPNGDDLLAT
jgi:hypothetical protein